MAHSNTVADRYGIKFECGPPRLANSALDNLTNLVQVNVPRHYLTEAVGNTDEWFVYVLVAQAAGAEQAPVWRTLKAFFDCVTPHIFPFSLGFFTNGSQSNHKATKPHFSC
jgi:hypothetical protein